MRHFSIIVVLAALLFALVVPSSPGRGQGIDSLDIKIGQMIMTGFRGIEAGDDSPVAGMVRDGVVGGVIYFDYDVERKSPLRNIVDVRQLRRLSDRLQSLARIPLLIAIDQEGGRINRLKARHGVETIPSHASLGAMPSADSTQAAARRLGATLREAGVNLDFAPVLDVNLNPSNPVIARLERSFSPDPERVARHGAAFVRGLHAEGILSAVKHFPGHGSSAGDSHEGFTDVTSTWKSAELAPYRRLIAAGECDMVMTAHVFHAALDPDWPATLSERVVGGLLRDSLGFDGVVVTDDLQMKAVAARCGLDTAVRRAVRAGVDILLFGNNTGAYEEGIARRAHAMLRGLVLRGELSRERIDASYRRIMRLKQRLAQAQ
jgi:beta-N-acetylhexosaminidase